MPQFKSITQHPNGETILVFAFRYALGRMTYSTSLMADVLIREWEMIHPLTRKQIQDDIELAIKQNDAGMECDIAEWRRVLELTP